MPYCSEQCGNAFVGYVWGSNWGKDKMPRTSPCVLQYTPPSPGPSRWPRGESRGDIHVYCAIDDMYAQLYPIRLGYHAQDISPRINMSTRDLIPRFEPPMLCAIVTSIQTLKLWYPLQLLIAVGICWNLAEN